MSPSGPIDPATSAPVALRGRIVTMDSGGTVLPDGVLYAKDGAIVALTPATHIADVEAKDWASFKARISRGQKMILHLAEGIDTPAHTHFAALHGPDGTWAITKDLVGIHCVGLKPADFAVFANHGGSMVWS